jgi:hypothetical protein
LEEDKQPKAPVQTQTPAAAKQRPPTHHEMIEDLLWYLPLKIATVIWFMALLGVESYAVAATWSKWWPYSALTITSLDDAKPGIYSFIGGSVGATLYAIRGFYFAAGPNESDKLEYQFNPNWIWWDILRPLMGGFLGVLAYTTLRLGLATVGSTTSTGTGSTTTYFFVAFIAGFAATEFMQWVKSTAKGIFKSDEGTAKPADTTAVDTTPDDARATATEGDDKQAQPQESKDSDWNP